MKKKNLTKNIRKLKIFLKRNQKNWMIWKRSKMNKLNPPAKNMFQTWFKMFSLGMMKRLKRRLKRFRPKKDPKNNQWWKLERDLPQAQSKSMTKNWMIWRKSYLKLRKKMRNWNKMLNLWRNCKASRIPNQNQQSNNLKNSRQI